MICAIYRSAKKEGMYLYIEKREQFDAVPDELLHTFGKPQFSMLFNLNGDKQLKTAPNQKVMEAIIAFACEGRILDLLQTFLLQTGTFEHDSSIHWELLKNKESREVIAYKKNINHLLMHPAFWPENTLYRKFINIDDTNKIFIIQRVDRTQKTGEGFIICINLSSNVYYNYALGVPSQITYTTCFSTSSTMDHTYIASESNRFASLRHEIIIKEIQPYHIFVLQYKKRGL